MKLLEKRLITLGAVRAENGHGPLGEHELTSLESVLGAALPADYRWFLSHFGSCTLGLEVVVAAAQDGEQLPITQLFGRGDDEGEDILMALNFYRDQLETSQLPIGEDIWGNIYVLDNISAQIFYRDFRLHMDLLVAHGFTDLLFERMSRKD
ncbi:MAG: SMI1/KNR4 family protein [Sulfitobacter sp.]|nr:SMI1/KNR4 family protein [Sulfitobacter sp.]